jgi:D-serine deaminase-like pyridoxal phosphate-dependent protein
MYSYYINGGKIMTIKQFLPTQLQALQTPCLLLDKDKMINNITRLSKRASSLNVELRPHLKSTKSIQVANLLLEQRSKKITVSTLAEAEYFSGHGINDILYAVGISPNKIDRVLALRKKGVNITIILDSLAQAQTVISASIAANDPLPVLIEIDCDGHRGGYGPNDPELVKVAQLLHQGGVELRGVMTHAGASYGVSGHEKHATCAEQERISIVTAANHLHKAGLPCPTVSVGSTPTAHAAIDLSGVTELRAGVYAVFDLVMAGIGVCSVDDIAVSILTTVIGHQKDKGWIMIDAGWMALSRDRGTASQIVDQGYGLVCDQHGNVLEDLIIAQANQEHGIITIRSKSNAQLPKLSVGTQLRILPNHACSTSAQHSFYHVLDKNNDDCIEQWPRIHGW